MFQTFEKLQEEKKQKIIDICIEEFAKNGYKKASTNEITKRADISKGILFHYFKNKKNLYLYILDYTIDYYSEAVFDYMDKIENNDVIEYIKAIGMMKIRLYSEEPIKTELLTRAFFSVPEEIKKELEERYQKLYTEMYKLIVEKVNKSKIKEGIDKNKAIEALMMLLNGLSSKYMTMYKDREKEILENMEDIMTEMEEYLEIMRYGIYE
ncbi:transcriptional regulator, TetR family [Gottschalkia purinilytica]|uniref:Transcriptional regulator, TetR family n=1 Tax=Gottschalkia purinilytica TaxID=1503 RepID=A0A0L0WA51_GOTPU|nr:TetR/AcrR family transcriptional regulator [Gottschalkia purinilytica]KNF08195.1 transcriptional regulator, TetR family [Gottschalkia purinilytica]